MKSISDGQFKSEVLGSKGLVLVDFWAEWCGPCRQLGPILEELSKEVSDVQIIKMNVDEAPNSAAECNVRSIPTMFLYKDGQQVDTKVGLNSKDSLISWINANR